MMHAPVHTITLRSNSSNKVPLVLRNIRDWYRFDTDKDQNLMKCWQVGDKMGKNGRHTSYKFCVNETNPRYPDNTQTWTKGKYPLHGDFVLQVKLILFGRSIVPNVHDAHKNNRERQWCPSSLWNFDQRCWDVHSFNRSKKEEKAYS